MAGMFRDASKFNQPIGGWNVAAVTDMGVLFSNARAFGQDVAAWNVQRVAALTGAFDSTSVGVSCAVYNAWGVTLQAAYPTWRALCLCGQVNVTLSMAANADTGAKSALTAQLSAVPTDANVSLSAVPQKGAVAVPLVPQSGGSRGSADLPSTGTWDIQLTIDGQSCPSQPRNVKCMPTFVDTPSGGCECPTGYKNVDGVCTPIDPSAKPKTACQVATFVPNPSVTKLTDNSTVNISFSDGRDPSQVTVLMRPKVAVRTASASDTAALLGLGQVVPGEYEVELQEAGTLCTLLSSVAVGCSDGYSAAGGTDGNCTKDSTECIDTIQWRDPTTKRCRQKPAVAVSGSSTNVAITVFKTNRTKTNSGTVQVRLTSGDVDPSAPVRWTAVLP
jgi:surface protein